jgi:hypothetical protein
MKPLLPKAGKALIKPVLFAPKGLRLQLYSYDLSSVLPILSTIKILSTQSFFNKLTRRKVNAISNQRPVSQLWPSAR